MVLACVKKRIVLALLISFTPPLTNGFLFTSNGRKSGGTALKPLHVSELHIPGYAQSKLPFVLTDKDLVSNNGVKDDNNDIDSQVQGLTRVCERTFTSADYESTIPFQDGSTYLLHRTVAPVLTATECCAIVDEAERVAQQIQWTKNRHGNFPTTDLPLVELPETLSLLRWALVERIYPLLRAQFGAVLPNPYNLRVADGFVVKYDAANGQKELKPHRDGSVLSFNIALNPSNEYEGGGTWFASLNDAVRIEQGHMVSHASGLLHGGHGITKGIRYILVAFVILEEFDSWSMRFYNQVRNL